MLSLIHICSVFGPLLFSVFVNDTPQLAGVRLSLFADETAAFAAEQKANFAAIKLQRQLEGGPRTGELPLTLLKA